MKKKLTEDYINENLNDILIKYGEDDNIIELINDVNSLDSSLLPIALFLAQKIDIGKMINGFDLDLEKIQGFGTEVTNELNSNKELIDNLVKVELFNNPKFADILSKNKD